MRYDRVDLLTIGELMAHAHVDGHRGDIVALKTALTQAALDGRVRLETGDILTSAELALPHRLKRQGIESAEVAVHALAEKIEAIRREKIEEVARLQEPGAAESSEEKKRN